MKFNIGDLVYHTAYKKTYKVIEMYNETFIGQLEGVGEFELEVFHCIPANMKDMHDLETAHEQALIFNSLTPVTRNLALIYF